MVICDLIGWEAFFYRFDFGFLRQAKKFGLR